MTTPEDRSNISYNGSDAERFQVIRDHEPIFRAILRDLKTRMGYFMPATLDPDGDLDLLLRLMKYPIGSQGFGIGEFEVGPDEDDFLKKSPLKLHWQKLEENQAAIEIHDYGILSGRNYNFGYKINPDESVEFIGEIPGAIIRS